MISRFMHVALMCVVGLLITTCDTRSQDTKSGKGGKNRGSAQKKATGVQFGSRAGRFKIYFPPGFANPVETIKNMDTPAGEFTVTLYKSAQDSTQRAFIVAFLDYPEKAFEEGIEVILDSVREGALQSMNATLETQESITLSGHPGRSITFTGMSNGRQIFGRIDYFIAKPRLYQVLFFTTDKAQTSTPEITRSFDSFTITAGKSTR